MTDFDQKAQSWDDDPMKQERAEAVARGIRAAIPLRPEMRALEYGCGTGLLSFALRDDFSTITLADTSRGMLQVLAEKIAAADATQMHPVLLAEGADALPPSNFDLLYSMMVLHHLPDTDASLRRFHELLAPGGWLAIADLDAEDGSFHGEEDNGVHRGFGRAALQRQVQAAGFTGVRFSTIFTVARNGRDYPVFLMTAVKG